MSLLKTASIGIFSATAFCAWSRAPTSPCSSPAWHMKTRVASKSMPLWLKTRASSIVSAVPLPSSLTPGAKLSSGALGSAGGGAGASGSRAAPLAFAAPWPPGRATVS